MLRKKVLVVVLLVFLSTVPVVSCTLFTAEDRAEVLTQQNACVGVLIAVPRDGTLRCICNKLRSTLQSSGRATAKQVGAVVIPQPSVFIVDSTYGVDCLLPRQRSEQP